MTVKDSAGMPTERAWYKLKDVPEGAVLYESDLRIQVWAYTVTHSQLLLRGDTGSGRVDLLFKSVDAMTIGTSYDGLTVRRSPTGLHLETQGRTDHVVAHAFGWLVDDGDLRMPSALAAYASATDPDRVFGL
ncbi:hypothetical protein [Kribbella sp. DT2]|uniref:hypothetical protein n=1 Tax=Kribbella sp. DT2 TaxID=3393427 RepID=UPI003CEA39ED